MNKPPECIDNARVLFWYWNDKKPIFLMLDVNGENAIPIHGLAICKYEGSGEVYRFCCSEDWETENDSSYGADAESISNAKNAPSTQFEISEINWIEYSR